jgi:hypothetical protein
MPNANQNTAAYRVVLYRTASGYLSILIRSLPMLALRMVNYPQGNAHFTIRGMGGWACRLGGRIG